MGMFCYAVRFVPVVGNPLVLFLGGRPFNPICAHVERRMEREGVGGESS